MRRIVMLESDGYENVDGIMKPCKAYWLMIYTPETNKTQFIGNEKTPEKLYAMTFEAIRKHCYPSDVFQIINQLEDL